MISIILTSLGVATLYLYHVNSAMKRVPDEARKLSPRRWTVDDVKAAYTKALDNPIDITDSLPPKQSRRYIVVGGSGTWDSCVLSLRLLHYFCFDPMMQCSLSLWENKRLKKEIFNFPNYIEIFN